jgi:hypothetical protein
MNRESFLNLVKNIADKDTSADPEHWEPSNPLWGHCAVVSLLAQDIFGGDLVKGSLKSNSKYSYLKSHIWNRIENTDEDFTAEQYPDISYQDLIGEIRTRDSIYNHSDTIRRYDILKERFNNQMVMLETDQIK